MPKSVDLSRRGLHLNRRRGGGSMAKVPAVQRIREHPERPENETPYPRNFLSTVPLTSTHRQAARLAALEEEIQSLSRTSLALPKGITTWWTQTFATQAPFAIIKKKMS